MFSRSTQLYLLALAFLIAATAAAITTFKEGRSIFTSGLTPEGKFNSLVDGSFRPADSELSKHSALDDCYDLLPSVTAKAQPAGPHQAFLDACAEIALSITKDVPVHAYAWLVGAMVAQEEGDLATFNSRLLFSRAMAPNEGWLAQKRAIVSARNIDDLDAAAKTAFDADIVLLAQGPLGAPVAAQIYVEVPEVRDRIKDSVEALSEAQQQRFIDNVRAITPIAAPAS